MHKPEAVLALADGTFLWGCSYGHPQTAQGELVFNTAMTGYQEILTDPSYAGQIITFTYPHIGNTGINLEDTESRKIHAAAMVLREPSPLVSNHRATTSLEQFLQQQKCPAIAEIDTRRLTRLLRDKGCQNACIMLCNDKKNKEKIALQALKQARALPPIQDHDWARRVSSKKADEWKQSIWHPAYIKEDKKPASKRTSHTPLAKKPHILVYDCGVKHNILRLITAQNCRVTTIPIGSKPADIVKQYHPDGIIISNGPGDPDVCRHTIEGIRYFLDEKIPLFGICLGHQLLGLACELKTYKMKHGHHGANHPVKDLTNGKVLITSQNHNFALSEDSLSDRIRITHRSLFDDTIQGIELLDKPAFSFQGHPEASPGPHDLNYLFAKFAKLAANA